MLDEKVHLTVDRGDMRDIIHCNEMHIGNYVGQILPLPLRLKILRNVFLDFSLALVVHLQRVTSLIFSSVTLHICELVTCIITK